MTWFEELTGFREVSPEQVRENLLVDGNRLLSKVNQRSYLYGRLETPSLGELRDRVNAGPHVRGQLTVNEIVGDIMALHTDETNAGALFQVASQFNLLEMVGPEVTPEQGVGRYENDHTQGPTCAIAAGAGTIYRNYFAVVNGKIGQSATRQIDCLADLGVALGNTTQRLWRMQNGYALATRAGLTEISQRLTAASAAEIDQLRRLLRIGLQWQTEVTANNATHTVTQAYCSALPVAYNDHPAALWEPFARLILESSYEATICTAILNARESGNRGVFLTLLGGGVFGNETAWIMESMARALRRYGDWDLHVAIVSYGTSKPHVRQLERQFT